MKKKRIIILAIFCLIIYSKGVAQRFNLGVEAGYSVLEVEMNSNDNIRKSASNYYGGYVDGRVFSDCQRFNAGLKLDYLTKNNHFELSSGLRYSRFTKSIDNSSFFFYLVETAQDVEYYRVSDITQKSDYLGIPLDFRFYPRDEIHFFSQFFSAGADFNYLINNNNDISFYRQNINASSDVSKTINKPSNFYGSLYAGIGFRLGKKDGFATVIQGKFPCLYYSDSFGLVRPYDGSAFQFEIEIQIPIK